MIKNFVLAAFMLLITSPLWAAGPSQMWRLEVTGSEDGILEISEIELREAAGGSSATELFKNYTFEVTDPAGLTAWSINHNLGVQRKKAKVDVIAYDVDVVAPGDYYHNENLHILSLRTHLSYDEIEFIEGLTGGEPISPEIGDVFYDTQLQLFSEWDGAVWIVFTPTVENGALPQPNSIEADSVDNTDVLVFIPGPPTQATGGTGANFVVELAFSEAVVGAATVRGASFDSPSVNQPGVSVPVIEGYERRASAAAFDGNKGSWFKSSRAPTERTPIAIQYTYWVGDPTRYPNIVEYAITAKEKDSAPKSWKLMMYKDGGWSTVDQQASIRFEDGETRVFSID